MKGHEAMDTSCNKDVPTGNKKSLHEEAQRWMPRISFLTIFKTWLDGAEQPALTWRAALPGAGSRRRDLHGHIQPDGPSEHLGEDVFLQPSLSSSYE